MKTVKTSKKLANKVEIWLETGHNESSIEGL